jgi:hypothetical protein
VNADKKKNGDKISDLEKLVVRLRTNITDQASFDFSKCRFINESTLTIYSRGQKFEKASKDCSSSLAKVKGDLGTCQTSLKDTSEASENLRVTLSNRDEEIKALNSKVERLSNETEELYISHAEKLGALRSEVAQIKSDLVAAGLCYQGSDHENCTLNLAAYTFLPQSLVAETCSWHFDVDRLQLFELAACTMVGDMNLFHLNLHEFIHENPILTSIFITTIILALIGLSAIIGLMIWVVVYCCRKSRTPELPVYSGKIRGGTLLRSMRTWSPNLRREGESAKPTRIKMTSFTPLKFCKSTTTGQSGLCFCNFTNF